tara:strand:+ start:1290 stop:1640 length:351 start_codon:yes stop_codon:yes gene_type:complete
MRKPFKMKGYSYPGKSPLREDTIKLPMQEIKELPVSTGDDKPIEPSKSYEEVSSEIKSEKKADRGEFFEGLAGQAGKALLEAGVQVGVNALLTPKNNATRKGPDVSGFSGIQFGRS